MTSNTDQSPRTGSEGIGTEPAAEGSAAEVPRARLTRLKINRFRNVKAGTELRFDDGINVLLGRNGTGKTTLLELICAITSEDLRAYREEAFDIEYQLTLRSLEISVRVQQTVPHSASADSSSMRNPRRRPSWKYEAVAHGNPGTIKATVNPREASITIGSKTVVCEAISPFENGFSVRQFLEAEADEPMATALVRSMLLGQDFFLNCFRLDEGLDVFHRLTENKELPRVGMPMHLNLHEGFEDMCQGAYAARLIFGGVFEVGAPVHQLTELSFDQDRLQFLRLLIEILGIKDMQLTMPLTMRSTSEQSGTTISIFGAPVFRVTTHQGTTYTHDHLSYGEKRLLAFMYHAAANPQILVADELVNGLHHEWIQACLDAIQGQAFLTSQNPLLLDHLPFSSGEEVQRRFILCDRDEHGDWVWRNMDQDAADAFYRAYDVGIQHVSEILETKGLW